MVKNLAAMQETWVQSLGWENPMKEDMATHSSILVWRIPIDREAWWVTVHGVAKRQAASHLQGAALSRSVVSNSFQPQGL